MRPIPPIFEAKILQLQDEGKDDEVHKAIKEMGLFKAPGPDRFQAGFFK